MVTAKQVSFGASLGLTFAADCSKEQASALITQALAERDKPKQITDRMRVKRFAVGAQYGWKGSEDDQLGYAYCNLQIDLLDTLAALDAAKRDGDSAGQLAALDNLVTKVRLRLTTPLKSTVPDLDEEPAPF